MLQIAHERQPNSIHASRSASSFKARLLPWIITMLVGGLFLGWIGAFGSYQYALGLRLALWLGLCAVAGVIALLIELTLVTLGFERRGMILTGLVWSCLLAAAMTPIIYLVNCLGAAQPLSEVPRYAVNSLIVSSILVAARLGFDLALYAASLENDALRNEPHPKILGRLKPALRESELLALKSEGHYVRVFTKDGDDLVLMRLKDAIEETGSIQGCRTHRSWWVAKAAIKEAVTSRGKTELAVQGDTLVPVSRTMRPILIEAGWI